LRSFAFAGRSFIERWQHSTTSNEKASLSQTEMGYSTSFPVTSGALTEWHDLLRLLDDSPQIQLSEGSAYITWSLQSDGLFSVSSLRRILT
ncbi:hypothetical protein LINPERHAP2_LOCUS21893, partial [Linum perenne]